MNKGYQILQFVLSKRLYLAAIGTVFITAISVIIAVNVIKNKAENGELDVLVNDNYSSVASLTSENSPADLNSSFTEDTESEKESEPQSSDDDTTNNTPPQGCNHKYKKETLEPTCSAQGYTENICEFCGDKYIDAYTEPKHSYGKYLCDYCDKPDPANPMYGLNAWLSKKGELVGGDRYASISYSDSTGMYSVNTSLYYDINYSFEYVNGSEIFRVDFGQDYCCTIFYKDTSNASCTTYELKNSAVSSKMDINSQIEEFYQAETDYTQEQISEKMLEKITPVLKIMEEKLLAPKTGYTLKDLGFTMF